MSKNVPWWSLIPAALFAALATLAIGPRVGSPDTQTLVIEFPGGGKIEVDSQRETMDHGALLDRLFATEFGRLGVLGWLREKRRLYPIDSADLADALHSEVCESIPETPLAQRLTKAKECAGLPVVAGLRRLSVQHQVPFHYVGDMVSAGIQFERPHRPGKGRVNVCRPGPYVGQKLQVIDSATNRSIEVEAGPTYTCTVAAHPGIQFDPDDAAELFQRPVGRVEEVIVVVL